MSSAEFEVGIVELTETTCGISFDFATYAFQSENGPSEVFAQLQIWGIHRDPFFFRFQLESEIDGEWSTFTVNNDRYFSKP